MRLKNDIVVWQKPQKDLKMIVNIWKENVCLSYLHSIKCFMSSQTDPLTFHHFLDAELNRYTKQVDEIDQRVGDLEKLVQELNEWCSELGESSPS